MAYIDIKSAFDSVDRVALWKALRGSSMPPFLLREFNDSIPEQFVGCCRLIGMHDSGNIGHLFW